MKHVNTDISTSEATTPLHIGSNMQPACVHTCLKEKDRNKTRYDRPRFRKGNDSLA